MFYSEVLKSSLETETNFTSFKFKQHFISTLSPLNMCSSAFWVKWHVLLCSGNFTFSFYISEWWGIIMEDHFCKSIKLKQILGWEFRPMWSQNFDIRSKISKIIASTIWQKESCIWNKKWKCWNKSQISRDEKSTLSDLIYIKSNLRWNFELQSHFWDERTAIRDKNQISEVKILKLWPK